MNCDVICICDSRIFIFIPHHYNMNTCPVSFGNTFSDPALIIRISARGKKFFVSNLVTLFHDLLFE